MARDVFTNRGFQNHIFNAKPANRTRGVDKSWFPRPDLQCKVNELHERCYDIVLFGSSSAMQSEWSAQEVFTNCGFQDHICNAKLVSCTRRVHRSWFPGPLLQCKVSEFAREVSRNHGFQDHFCDAKAVNCTRGIHKSWFPESYLQCKASDLHERCWEVLVSEIISAM